MDSVTPRYLYRAYSDVSNGWNSSNYLAPQFSLRDFNGTIQEIHGLRFDTTERKEFMKMPKFPPQPPLFNKEALMVSPKQQLILALQRKIVADNAFIFFTSSFPQVLVHASYKNRKESNVRITCLDTWTAKTSQGHSVSFHAIRDIRQLMNITLTDGHVFEPLDFEDVYVTTDTIVPGENSTTASFGTLLGSELAQCVPEMGVIAKGKAGVAAPIRILREYWFNLNHRKSTKVRGRHLNLAAKLAATFRPILTSDPVNDVPMHIFAWLVAMIEPEGNTDRLHKWLHKHGNTQTNNAVRPVGPMADETWLSEVNGFNSVMAELSHWSINITDIANLASTIPAWEVTAAAKEFREQRRAINRKRNEEISARKVVRVAKSDERKRKRAEEKRKREEAEAASNAEEATLLETDRLPKATKNDQSPGPDESLSEIVP